MRGAAAKNGLLVANASVVLSAWHHAPLAHRAAALHPAKTILATPAFTPTPASPAYLPIFVKAVPLPRQLVILASLAWQHRAKTAAALRGGRGTALHTATGYYCATVRHANSGRLNILIVIIIGASIDGDCVMSSHIIKRKIIAIAS